MDSVEEETDHRQAAIDAVEEVIGSYLEQLDEDQDVDTADLAENVVRHLEREGFVR